MTNTETVTSCLSILLIGCVSLNTSIANISTYVGLEVFTALVMKSNIFWDMTPCSPLSVSQLATCLLAELISSTLKMEAICSSETSIDTQRTTWRHIPENNTLHIYINTYSDLSVFGFLILIYTSNSL
jgi:hypothetical protein